MQNVIFGASSAGFDFLKSNSDLKFHYFCDNDENKIGHLFYNIPVVSVNQLKKIDSNIFICSAFREEIYEQLVTIGFNKDKITLVGSEKLSWAEKTFVSVLDVVEFLKNCTKENIPYVIIRNWETIFSDKFRGDIDILIDDTYLKQFNKISELFTKPGDIKMDVCSVYGTQGYRYHNMPLFPKNISKLMLESGRIERGVTVCSDLAQLVNLMYYCVAIKGEEAKIPWDGMDEKKIVNKIMLKKDNSNYVLRDYLKKINQLHFDIFGHSKISSLKDIYVRLFEMDYFPRFDTYRKTISNDTIRNNIQAIDPLYVKLKRKSEELSLSSPHRRFIMFFLRSKIFENKYFQHFENWLELNSGKVKVSYQHDLSDEQIYHCTDAVRGGNWFDDYGEIFNGFPCRVYILQNIDPAPLQDHQKQYFPFEIYDDTYFLKENFRNYFLQQVSSMQATNLVHSTDDNLELLLYCEELGIDLENILDR